MSGAIPPLLYAFMAWCSVKAQGQLCLLSLPLPSLHLHHQQRYSQHYNKFCGDLRFLVYFRAWLLLIKERFLTFLSQYSLLSNEYRALFPHG
jgi:hypothetical protein